MDNLTVGDELRQCTMSLEYGLSVNWRSRQESLQKQKPGASSVLKTEVVRGLSKKHARKRVLPRIRSRVKRGDLEASQKQVTLAQPLHHFEEASRKSEPHGKKWKIAKMLHSCSSHHNLAEPDTTTWYSDANLKVLERFLDWNSYYYIIETNIM